MSDVWHLQASHQGLQALRNVQTVVGLAIVQHHPKHLVVDQPYTVLRTQAFAHGLANVLQGLRMGRVQVIGLQHEHHGALPGSGDPVNLLMHHVQKAALAQYRDGRPTRRAQHFPGRLRRRLKLGAYVIGLHGMGVVVTSIVRVLGRS
jgi:hypothetical protein